AILAVGGEKSRVAATECIFNGNTGGLEATEQATLVLTTCTFTGNGITGGPGTWTQGLIAVHDRARATISGGIFQNNHQGVAVGAGGTVDLTGCHFTACG